MTGHQARCEKLSRDEKMEQARLDALAKMTAAREARLAKVQVEREKSAQKAEATRKKIAEEAEATRKVADQNAEKVREVRENAAVQIALSADEHASLAMRLIMQGEGTKQCVPGTSSPASAAASASGTWATPAQQKFHAAATFQARDQQLRHDDQVSAGAEVSFIWSCSCCSLQIDPFCLRYAQVKIRHEYDQEACSTADSSPAAGTAIILEGEDGKKSNIKLPEVRRRPKF